LAATPPSRRSHTAGSATLLLMASAVVSGLLALVRIKYINVLFGAGVEQDAYRAAFKLPDLVSYFLVGSAASVSLITLLNRYRVAGDDEGANRALSVVLSTMLVVLTAATLLAAALAPLYVRIAYPDFLHDARGPLCIALTRWLLPAQLFFFIGSMMSAHLQVRKIFLYQACTPVIYNGGIVLGAVFLHRQLGVYSLVVGVLGGVIVGSALLNTVGALRGTTP
jgi:putative peptidoglycan lipid II flippase